MSCDVDSIEDLLRPWKEVMFADWKIPNDNSPALADGLKNLTADHQLVRPVDDACGSISRGAALSMGCVESSFLVQTVASINDAHHADLAPILVSLQYLSQLEGPFWRQLRAQGLVYGYHLNLNVNEGLLHLSLYRASHPVAAYKQVRAILQSHVEQDGVWRESLHDSAKSSLIFELVAKEKAVGDVVVQSVASYLKKTPVDYNKRLIERVSQVTVAQMKSAFVHHVTPLLDASKCRCSIVCHPSKLDDIVSGFAALGQQLQPYTSVEQSPLHQQL